MGIIVVLILGILAYKSIGFRAYISFNLLAIGVGALIAGLFMKDSFFTIGGLVMALIGVGILFLCSLKVETSARLTYMLHMFLYGMFLFLRVILIALIITIPFASMFKAMAAEYREMVVVDAGGNVIKRVIVDESLKDANGNQYTYREDDPY